VEQSVLGGVAHLLNFDGSDTLSAAYYAQVSQQLVPAQWIQQPLVICSHAKETIDPQKTVHFMLPDRLKVKPHKA